MTSPDQKHDEGDEHEIWKTPPPPPMPNFPEIPAHLRKVEEKPESNLTGIAAGWSLALDFIGTIVASWFIGFGIDYWQKTSPWGSLIGLGFGFAYAIYRILRQSQLEEKRRQRK